MNISGSADIAMELGFLFRQYAKATIALESIATMERPTVPKEDMQITSIGRDRGVTVIPREVLQHLVENGAMAEALKEYQDKMVIALAAMHINVTPDSISVPD